MQQARQISTIDKAVTRSGNRLSMVLRATEVWLVISVVEVVHGSLRTAFLEPFVGDFTARQISVFTGSALVFATTYVFRNWLGATSVRECLTIGLLWIGLMIGFELLLGRMVLGLPWERLLSDYDLARGGLMPFGLMVMLLSPLLVHRISRSR